MYALLMKREMYQGGYESSNTNCGGSGLAGNEEGHPGNEGGGHRPEKSSSQTYFSTIFSHQVYWDQDGGREGPPFTRNPHRTCWRSSYALFSCENFAVHIYIITIFVAQVGTSPHFGFVSASEFFLVALVALEWVKSEGKSLFVCHPAEEGEDGGAVGDLSRCNGGKEDARVVLESKGES